MSRLSETQHSHDDNAPHPTTCSMMFRRNEEKTETKKNKGKKCFPYHMYTPSSNGDRQTGRQRETDRQTDRQRQRQRQRQTDIDRQT